MEQQTSSNLIMTKEDYNFFTALVVGADSDKIMEKYDKNKKVNPYVIYHYKDAGKLRNNSIQLYQKLLSSGNLSKIECDSVKAILETIESQSDIEFYLDYTEKYEYDEKTGDAITTENPYGKWTYCKIGKLFSIPFITKHGIETFSCKKGDVDWKKMHLFDSSVFESAWDMVMGDRKPENEQDKKIYENMKNRTAYFEKFGTKENYIASNTSFWCYAYVDKNGWFELEDNMDQFKWVTGFYDRFISPLTDNETITIYECRR